MNQAIKAKKIPMKSARRQEPTPADYHDEISKGTLAEIARLAASKDDKDKRWETVREPAW